MKRTIYILIVMTFYCMTVAFRGKAKEEKVSYSWLEGTWTGRGFGGVTEEIWSAPDQDGIMMGMYRHHNAEGKLAFYEFMTLDQKGIHVKHFSPALDGWEEKDKHHTFELIRFSERKIEMNGMTYHLIEDDQLEISMDVTGKDGKTKQEVFYMKRR